MAFYSCLEFVFIVGSDRNEYSLVQRGNASEDVITAEVIIAGCRRRAVAVAAAVLIPVYGRKQIASERPFKAELSGGVWDVNGSLHCDPPGSPWFMQETCHDLLPDHDQIGKHDCSPSQMHGISDEQRRTCVMRLSRDHDSIR
jgi:hypothetical protein